MCVKCRNKIRKAANDLVFDSIGLAPEHRQAFDIGAKHGELMAGLFLQKAVEVLREDVHQLSMMVEAGGGESIEDNLVSLNTMNAVAQQLVGEALFVMYGRSTISDPEALRGLNHLERIHELEPTTVKPKSAPAATH